MAVKAEQLTFAKLVSRFLVVWKNTLPEYYVTNQQYLFQFAEILGEVGSKAEQPPLRIIDEFVFSLETAVGPQYSSTVITLLENFCDYLVSRGYITTNPFYSPNHVHCTKNQVNAHEHLQYDNSPQFAKQASLPIVKIHPRNQSKIGLFKHSREKEINPSVSFSGTHQVPPTPTVTQFPYAANESKVNNLQRLHKTDRSSLVPIESSVIDRIPVAMLPLYKEWYIDYRQYKSKKKICKRTAENYERHIDQFCNFHSSYDYEHVTNESLTHFVKEIEHCLFTEDSYAPNTRSTKKAAISGFLRGMSEKKGIHVPDFDEILAITKAEKLVKDPHKAFTIEEIDSWLAVVVTKSSIQKLETLVPMFMGTRAEETVEIKFRNIDFAEGVLHVTGKGRKYRRIPLAKIIIPLFKELLLTCTSLDEYVFSTRQSDHMSTRTLQNHIKQIAKDAKLIWEPSAHDLRKTFCTLEAKYTNVDVYRLKRKMGHADLNTTNEYVQDIEKSTHLSLEILYSRWARILYGTEDLESLVT